MKQPEGKGVTARPRRSRNCPICGKPTDPDHTPFCSRRCAQIDLHRWLSGSYVIPGRTIESDEDGNGGGETPA